MRLVLMGTGPFGVPTFRRLYDTDHEILAAVTSPLKARGKRRPVPGPVRRLAEERGTPIFDPEDVNEQFQSLLPVVATGVKHQWNL